MVIAPDEWLSEALARPSFRLVLEDGSFSENDRRELTTFLSGLTPGGFVYCKIPASPLQPAHVLESLGFRLIDTNVIFEKPLSRDRPNPATAAIQFAGPGDENGVVELARGSFRNSRFHLDPSIPGERADLVKAEWARNYFRGKRGKWLVTAKVNGSYAGFLLLLKDEKKRLVVDLIAVSREFQRKGIARGMISYAETHCEDAEKIRVGTQIVNRSSINLYENMGFKLVDTNYVFHYHYS